MLGFFYADLSFMPVVRPKILRVSKMLVPDRNFR